MIPLSDFENFVFELCSAKWFNRKILKFQAIVCLDCEMSHRSLEEQLEELLDLADLCPVYFHKPVLAIYFANGVMQKMAGKESEI